MMKKTLVLAFLLLLFLLPLKNAFAYDSLSLPNNKFGVHILFPSEIEDAARLVNTSGGDWGYVTIPIQSYDKDLEKWQKFMDDCKRLHLIPIIRLATNGDYFNTKVWEKPNDANTVDFANFLNSLDWPIKNRYVVVYNEVNRGDEWGGTANPEEYAKILQYAITSFKTRSPDFFILSAGLDNAASTTDTSVNEYDFMRQMDVVVPGIFSQIDAVSSHSYPNPGFIQPPELVSSTSIYSFKTEKQLADSLSKKNLPVFITETNWTTEKLDDQTVSLYFKTAFETAWSDSNVVAVTPFLLTAGTDPFKYFSLLNSDGKESLRYKAIFKYPKIKGKPKIAEIKNVLGQQLSNTEIPKRDFSKSKNTSFPYKRTVITTIYKWLLKL